MKCKSLYVLGVFFLSNVALAEHTGKRNINDIGCHLNDGTCYVSITGDPVGPSSCHSRSVRWNKDSHSGKETLSLLMTAFTAGKQAGFYISDSCYSRQPHFPTFRYINVYK